MTLSFTEAKSPSPRKASNRALTMSCVLQSSKTEHSRSEYRTSTDMTNANRSRFGNRVTLSTAMLAEDADRMSPSSRWTPFSEHQPNSVLHQASYAPGPSPPFKNRVAVEGIVNTVEITLLGGRVVRRQHEGKQV